MTVHWGEPFVKACYFLEGDGPLALECYESITKVSATIQVGHTPNVQAVARQLTGGAPPSSPQHLQLIAYAKACVQPGLDYLERQLESSLKSPLAAFKCARLFSPQKINLIQPDANALAQKLAVVPFLNEADMVAGLTAELPDYLA